MNNITFPCLHNKQSNIKFRERQTTYLQKRDEGKALANFLIDSLSVEIVISLYRQLQERITEKK